MRHLRQSLPPLVSLLLALSTGALAGALDLELQGRTAPNDPEEFTTGYESCSAELIRLLPDTADADNTASTELRYRPTPLFADTGADGLRAFFGTPSFMVHEKRTYRLVTLHLHSVANAQSAKSSTLLANFVHAGLDGSYGVLGVRVVEGSENPELQGLLLAAVGEEVESGLNPGRLLPAMLTTSSVAGAQNLEDCEYSVNWYLSATPIQASGEQLQAMRLLLDARET